MTARVHRRSAWLVVLAACAHRPPNAAPPPRDPDDRVAIIAAEIAGNSARLVAIDEHGDRQFVAVIEAGPLVLDTNPAVSPDGRWVVFESNRGMPPDRANRNLWIAKVGVEQAPARLTTGDWYDVHPCWTPDGNAIVFASSREGGDLDLWRLPMASGRAAAPAVQITHDPRQEVTPTVARDGTIYYALAERDRQTTKPISMIRERTPDGRDTQIIGGASPALSPDESQLAFSTQAPPRPPDPSGIVIEERPDSELWILRRADRSVRRVVELPPSQEGGPVWSRDGRFLFATSALSADQGAVFSSVIHVDLTEQPPRARMLEDRAGGIKRLTPAIVAATLDAAALRGNPEYLPELARIMTEAIEKARGQEP